MSNASRQAEKNSSQAPPSKPAAPAPLSGAALLVAASTLARSDAGPEAAALVAALFTERELFQLRNACRDSDNENAIRFLNAALARAEGGK